MRLWLKIAVAAAMTLAILVPLMMIFGVIQERQRYRQEVVLDIARNVGQAQTLAGPVLVVPYVDTVEKETTDDKGATRRVREQRELREYFFPETLKSGGVLTPSIHARGLHAVRTYHWRGELAAGFDVTLPIAPAGVERRLGQPYLSWGIADVRGLRGTPVVEVDGRKVSPRQGSGVAGRAGLHVVLPAVAPGRAMKFGTRLAITLAGTERFGILPLARSNDIVLKSDWEHPSFSGILPRHDINPQGFDAYWQVDALATDAQQRWREGDWVDDSRDVARVVLVDPVNPYLMAERATKYGVLFVALTFAGFFMFELIRQVRVHPIQYGLVGLAIAIFFLLLLSLSEHIAFGWAYLAAASACVGLIGFYLSAVLGGIGRGLGFAAMLATLYAALYGLLLMEDNALAVGSGLLFVILAAIMVATRKMDWYALGGGRLPPPLSPG
ncbi:cell envelope integrity protein CreD [Solilutibacter pythonis]|nr:cell envelope integrity protein CreD [Lysobacter pythonis]